MSIIRTKEDLDSLLLKCIELNGTDLHFSVGAYPAVKIYGKVKFLRTDSRVSVSDVKNIASIIIPDEIKRNKDECDNCTFPYSIVGQGRFRVNLFKQRSSYSASFRIGNFYCPTKEQLRLPDEIDSAFSIDSGLIIITGPIGSGRSSTGAYFLDRIRQEKASFIDTIEDPIEYLFKHDKSVINQMEVGIDVPNLLSGFNIALKNYSDVIFISSLIDKDVIKLALESARAGKIVIGVMSVLGVEEAIRNIIDIFPNENINYIRSLLSNSLKCVISQQLIPDTNKSYLPLCEILYGIQAVSNLIKENKIPQLSHIIENSQARGMLSVDNHLASLVAQNMITAETAKAFAQNWSVLSQKILTIKSQK